MPAAFAFLPPDTAHLIRYTIPTMMATHSAAISIIQITPMAPQPPPNQCIASSFGLHDRPYVSPDDYLPLP